MIATDHYRSWMRAISSGLVGPSETAIRLSRYKWLSPEESKGVTFPDYLIIDLVPFAQSWGGDFVGWVESAKLDYPLVLSPRDDEFATAIGCTFGEALFYLILEELDGCWFDSTESGNTVWKLNDWVNLADDVLSADQVSTLKQIFRVTPRLSNG